MTDAETIIMDQPTPLSEFEHPPVSHPAKRLALKTQLLLLVGVAALVVAGFVLAPAALHRLGLSEAPARADEAASAVPGAPYKVSDRQWAGLKVVPVAERMFQDASETDGKIAIDDDGVTPVFSPYSGRITKLIARAGDVVHRGDPLFAIQATELAQAQNDLISAMAGLKTAKAQLNLSTTNEKRQHDLYVAQGAALKDWQQAQVDLATAQGGMNSAAIALSAVRSRLRILGKSDKEIDQIETTPDILNLAAESVVDAPIGGTVTQRQVGLGQNIVSAASGAANPVFMIGDLSKVWLVANAREEDAPTLHKGDAAEVHVLAFPDRVFNARITYVGAAIDPNTHRLPVRAEVENPNGDLKPEMLAGFRIITGEDAAAPAVPAAALVYEGETAHVWVADPASKTLTIRQVVIGRIRDGQVEILQGLKQGESVVTQGAVFIDRAVVSD